MPGSAEPSTARKIAPSPKGQCEPPHAKPVAGPAKAAAATVFQLAPPFVDRKYMSAMCKPVKSRAGSTFIKPKASCHSGFDLGLPWTGPVTSLKVTIELPSGICHAPTQQV